MAELLTAGACVDGRYILQRPLGEGTFGGVWRARDARLSDRLVAVKFLKQEFLEHPPTVARFEAEGEALAKVSHANVVAVIDRGTWEGQRFLVTEFVDGVALSAWIDRHRSAGRAPSVQSCLVIFDQLCAGMEAAHAVRAPGPLVHRDLKPDNILLRSGSDGETVKIVDFGIAQLGGRTATRSGVMMGTPLYMAPEQAMGNTSAIGPWTDVFSLGVILTEMLTLQSQVEEGEPWWGTALHRGASVRALLSALGPEVQPEVWDVVATCLKAHGTERFQHAGALRAALRPTLPSAPPTASRSGSFGPPNPLSTPSRDVTLLGDPRPERRDPSDASAARALRAGGSVSTELQPIPWMKLVVGVCLGAFALAAAVVFFVVRSDHARAKAIEAASPRGPRRAVTPPAPAAALDDLSVATLLNAWKRAVEAPRAGDDLSAYYAPRVRWHSSDRIDGPEQIGRFLQENAALGGFLRVDLARSTLSHEPPNHPDVAAACRSLPDAAGPVLKIRAQVEERRPDRIATIPCQTLRGVYLLRARRTAGGLRICHETWSIDEGICSSCPSAAVCSRRR